MRFDLVPIRSNYRGIGRSLLGTDLLTEKTEKKYKWLLEEYFKYLEIELFEEVGKKSFDKTIDFYKLLRSYDIMCEIIVYNESSLQEAFGYPIEFLGIDIVHDMCESLIEDSLNPRIEKYINTNGLCRNLEDVKTIIPFQDCGNVDWKPCYVYKVII